MNSETQWNRSDSGRLIKAEKWNVKKKRKNREKIGAAGSGIEIPAAM